MPIIIMISTQKTQKYPQQGHISEFGGSNIKKILVGYIIYMEARAKNLHNTTRRLLLYKSFSFKVKLKRREF